jgi:predicted site-specific integrase-resolvase
MTTSATLSRTALAELLGVAPSTVSRWVKTGIIPGPLKGTRRYPREAVFDRLRYGVAAAQALNQLSVFDQWMATRGHRQV